MVYGRVYAYLDIHSYICSELRMETFCQTHIYSVLILFRTWWLCLYPARGMMFTQWVDEKASLTFDTSYSLG